jgi:hypothetical protein
MRLQDYNTEARGSGFTGPYIIGKHLAPRYEYEYKYRKLLVQSLALHRDPCSFSTGSEIQGLRNLVQVIQLFPTATVSFGSRFSYIYFYKF